MERFERDEITLLLIEAAGSTTGGVGDPRLPHARPEPARVRRPARTAIEWTNEKVHVRAAIARGCRERHVTMAPWAIRVLHELHRSPSDCHRGARDAAEYIQQVGVRPPATAASRPAAGSTRTRSGRRSLPGSLRRCALYVARDLMGHRSVSTTNDSHGDR